MLGSGNTGLLTAVVELDGEVFEFGMRACPVPGDLGAVHRVLEALARRDRGADAALEALRVGRDDLALALRTGVIGVTRRAPRRAVLDPISVVDLAAL